MQVDVRHGTETRGRALTDVLESTFTIPDVRVEDVNGDGRRDLLVSDGDVRAFHLQRSDGTFPREPDVSVDLALFRDTTPEADVKLGRTLAGADKQRHRSRDLNGDGIPDHVIAHRRKVWVFLGGSDGPQFEEPVAILKTAEDVTALLLVRVDDDPLPDLVLLRVQVPTAAAILTGLLTEWDVELSASGYRGRAEGGFETEAGWRGDLTVRLPALLGVIRDPDAVIRRFEDLSRRFGQSVSADLDGDGSTDVLLIDDEDAPRADVWLGADGARDDDAERIVGHRPHVDPGAHAVLPRRPGPETCRPPVRRPRARRLGGLARRSPAPRDRGRRPRRGRPPRDRRALRRHERCADRRPRLAVSE
jgi:hypothetical protein